MGLGMPMMTGGVPFLGQQPKEQDAPDGGNEMDRKKATDWLYKWYDAQKNLLSFDTKEALRIAIAALREEREPCERCDKLEFAEKQCALLEKQRAEWEKAWDALVKPVNNLIAYGTASYSDKCFAREAEKLDPRRKPAPVPEADPYDLWERSIKGWRM